MDVEHHSMKRNTEDRRLIEDYLPIEAISKEASREKSVRKGHISTLHLWWARRPLVACRAAVYGALVPASRFVPENGPDNKKQSLGRANAAKFVERLCKYPGEPRVIQQAQEHILEAHAERLTAELAEAAKTGRWPGWVEEFKWPKDKPMVTREDIEAGRAPRPRVLDMFAGGGAIPLEALRLGCEAYALDLNPVAHIIELCTLVYPQKYGKPDPNARGMTGLPAPRRYWVYVIRCEDDSFYIGQTDNIVRRYQDHIKGKIEWTAAHKPLELIHWEEFKTREEAVAREKELKTGFGRKWIKREYTAHRLAAQREASRQAGPKNTDGLPASLKGLAQPGKPTWGGLAEEVRYWGQWVLREVKKEIGDLYPPVPDPEYRGKRPGIEFDRKTGNWVVKGSGGKDKEALFETEDGVPAVPPGYLMPVAYLWTRTVKCKNPACGATVPLSKLQWIRRERGGKPGRYIALLRTLDRMGKKVVFTPAHGGRRDDLQPTEITMKAGSVACPFCGAVNGDEYVKAEGCAGRIGLQLMAVGATDAKGSVRTYLGSQAIRRWFPSDVETCARLQQLVEATGTTPPDEPVVRDGKQSVWVDLYGLTDFGKVFTNRQLVVGVAVAGAVRATSTEMARHHVGPNHTIAVCAYLGMALDRHMNQNNTLTIFNAQGETIEGAVNDKTLPMAWDFPEPNPFCGMTGSLQNALKWVVDVAAELADTVDSRPSHVIRGSATTPQLIPSGMDAVVTDPPYYDNVSYGVLSDFFYGWLKRSVGSLFPQHFASVGTPKKNEAVMDSARYGGSREDARRKYEEFMEAAFRQAWATLKPGGTFACVYAHKTTLGWATLVDGLRRGGFCITEAWPVETERKGGRKGGKAMLASSIFLVGRKREESTTGSYESDVQPELQRIVRERVETLWKQGISGADLLIACVGAGLRAFTRFARVEYANGEEVPAERFLAEVETVVLETILARLSKEIGGNGGRRTSLSGVDPATRFYLLWRYTYRWTELDAGEAVVFANGTHVELDGPGSLSYGSRPLVKKKKGKYRLLDFTERGKDEKLGLPHDGQPAPLIDALHRTLWLMENRPLQLPEFLRESRVNREQMRLVAQALAGPALKGSELMDVSPTGELAALAKLTANWRAVVEDAALTPLEREARRTGQQILFDKETDT